MCAATGGPKANAYIQAQGKGSCRVSRFMASHKVQNILGGLKQKAKSKLVISGSTWCGFLPHLDLAKGEAQHAAASLRRCNGALVTPAIAKHSMPGRSWKRLG
jgi:hypothetical protein